MNPTSLIFYPEPYVGFNKAKLIERHLMAAGIIGSKFTSSPFFSAGHSFRKFIPKVDSIHKYRYSLIRIQIQAVGVWAKASTQSVIENGSNLVLVEGDIFGYPLERYAALRDFLSQITGDNYVIGVVHNVLGECVSEPEANSHATARMLTNKPLPDPEAIRSADRFCHPIMENLDIIE